MAAVDRISELPEPILHHILSFLSSKQAIQTSAISKTWRHVGLTGPKIELRESFFKKSGRASFLSVLDKTLQRYNHRNLSVHEFILEMPWESESESDDLVDLEKTLFKGLKRLSLTNVHIKAETLEKIIRSCPLLEYLRLSDCVGLKTIPVTIFQAEFLSEVRITGCNLYVRGVNLIASATQLLLIKRLKTLSLANVNIPEETLEKIMCGCPLIERLLLFQCEGLTNIQLNKSHNNNNLNHFTGYFRGVRIESFEIHAPSTIETINIVDCPNWYGHDKYFFPCLKTLYLSGVKLSAQLFESFSSSNFPSLEDLELDYHHDLSEIQEIRLTSCSIKRLVLKMGSIKPIKATIYAPNIHYFKFSGNYPPQLIFHSETTGEWKSRVNMWCDNKDSNLAWLLQLSELLNSLRESQIISLKVYYTHFKNVKVEDAVFWKPVPLEHVHVKGVYRSFSLPDLLKCLFLICRPRFIGMQLYIKNPVTDLNKEKDQLAEFIKFKTIRNEGEMSRSCLWERDLEEISMQLWDQNSQEWHTVGVEGTSFPEFTTSYPKIRFSVKWRD